MVHAAVLAGYSILTTYAVMSSGAINAAMDSAKSALLLATITALLAMLAANPSDVLYSVLHSDYNKAATLPLATSHGTREYHLPHGGAALLLASMGSIVWYNVSSNEKTILHKGRGIYYGTFPGEDDGDDPTLDCVAHCCLP